MGTTYGTHCGWCAGPTHKRGPPYERWEEEECTIITVMERASTMGTSATETIVGMAQACGFHSQIASCWGNTMRRGTPAKYEPLLEDLEDMSKCSRVEIRSCRLSEGDESALVDFEMGLGDKGRIAFQVRCTIAHFEQADREIRMMLPDVSVGDLPVYQEVTGSAAACFLQQWLDEVLRKGLLPRSPALQQLLGLPGPWNLWALPCRANLGLIISCHQPLIFNIAGFLAGAPKRPNGTSSPRDLLNLYTTSRKVAMQLQPAMNSLWAQTYAERWHAFYEWAIFQGPQDWRLLYLDTLVGRHQCVLEVFEREKKIGFAMAAMAARVQWSDSECGYIARYLSASEVKPEHIPLDEEHRIRFCPASARDQLRPGSVLWREASTDYSTGDGRVGLYGEKTLALPTCYPYKVLEGTDGLVVGQGVELLWKMQYGSPFGWWYGHLEALHRDSDGKAATAAITFRHFPSNSRWYRLEVRFGDGEMRPCAFGGYTGGLRAVSAEEHKQWMRYFPQEPIFF